jgi:hypothetical protein
MKPILEFSCFLNLYFMLQIKNIFTFFSPFYYFMETCGIVWIQYNEYKIFKNMHKALYPLFFFSFFPTRLEMPSKLYYHV